MLGTSSITLQASLAARVGWVLSPSYDKGVLNFVGAAGLTRWLVPLRDASNSGSDRYTRPPGAS